MMSYRLYALIIVSIGIATVTWTLWTPGSQLLPAFAGGFMIAVGFLRSLS